MIDFVIGDTLSLPRLCSIYIYITSNYHEPEYICCRHNNNMYIYIIIILFF